MQTTRIIQVVILMALVAMAAASCSATREYTSKVFPSRTTETKDSTEVAVVKTPRFLDLGDQETEQEGWVTTDIIMGRDSAAAAASTAALDELAANVPATSDSATLAVKKEMVTVKTEAPKTAATKKKKKETPKAAPAPEQPETVKTADKPVATEEPEVVKSARPGEVRSKRTREEQP